MGQVDLQQMTAARLSSMISTGEVFDERLLRSSFENEFCRILGIVDMNPLRGIERVCRMYGCNSTTGMIVFRYWLTNRAPQVRFLVKWREKFFSLDSFEPRFDDVEMRGQREVALWLTLPQRDGGFTVDGRRRIKGEANWCDGLVDVPVSRQLSFRMRAYDKNGVVHGSFDLEPLWVWGDVGDGQIPRIEVLLDIEGLYLKTDRMALEPMLDELFPASDGLSLDEFHVTQEGASRLLLGRDKLRHSCRRLNVYEAERNAMVDRILRERRTPRTILEDLRRREAAKRRGNKPAAQEGNVSG